MVAADIYFPVGICLPGQGDECWQSREAVVDYMMPLGLHHQFAWGHHYGPEPWCSVRGARPDWLPSYYHRADKEGIGFDRSSKGSNAVSQYPDSLRLIYNDKTTCPEVYLLWFHHVPWQYRMKKRTYALGGVVPCIR